MTGANIIEDVCSPISYTANNATQSAQALRWINDAQLDMAQYDFPELITRNGTFTTNGDESYDLTGASYFGSTFLRVIDKSVRIDDRRLEPRPKSFIDTIDPSRNYGSEALYYVMGGRKDFRLWPAESSGSTLYMDWVKYPATITSATAEADISFDKDWHQLIVEGALVYGLRSIGYFDDSMRQRNLFRQKVREAFNDSVRANFTTRGATPIAY